MAARSLATALRHRCWVRVFLKLGTDTWAWPAEGLSWAREGARSCAQAGGHQHGAARRTAEGAIGHDSGSITGKVAPH